MTAIVVYLTRPVPKIVLVHIVCEFIDVESLYQISFHSRLFQRVPLHIEYSNEQQGANSSTPFALLLQHILQYEIHI